MVTREYPPFVVGGIATHTFYLVKYLKKQGVDCTVTSFGDPHLSTEDTIFISPSSSVLKSGNSRISEDLGIVRDIYKLTNYVKKLLQKRKYDIVHVQEPYVGGLIMYSRKITTFHTTGAGETKALFSSTLNKTSYGIKRMIFNTTLGHFMEISSILSSKLLITPSYIAKTELVKYYKVDPRKIKVIHNGIEIPKNVPNTKSARRVLRLPKDKVIVFTVGRHIPRKRYDLLIEAVARLDKSLREQIYVVIGGRGPLTPLFKLLIRKYDLENVVTLTGWIPEEKLWLYYSAADIFVLTSDAESAPITLLEAVAIGKAIVTTRVGDYAYMMKNGVHGILIKPSDVNGLARALKELVIDENLRRRLSIKAKEFASLFSWRKVAMYTLEVYKEVLKRVKV